MKFSIGYNQDIKLLDLLDIYKDNIESFYFPIPCQYLGTGRHVPQKKSYLNEIPEIIKKCNRLNIKSQLLLNATCEGEQGLEKIFFLRIIDYLRKLKCLGLKSVIVTNPVYISEIKERIKGIEVESSVNCYVKTLEQALYLKELGVDILVIDRDINRNIPLIKEIKKRTGLKIKIMLNEGCLRDCPFRKMHFNFIAHSGRKRKVETISGIFLEKWCMKILSQNPAKIFSVPFILPEALKHYIGCVDYFKISCRDSSTSRIELRLKAYLNQDFNGNLLSLLDCSGLEPYFKYIDSQALNAGNFFKKMLKCLNCRPKCNYCKNLLSKAVVTDSHFLAPTHPIRIQESKKAVKIYGRILKNFTSEAAIYLDLARAYFMLKRYGLAIQVANKAIEINPKKLAGHFILGSCYKIIGQNKKAIEAFKKAEKITPKYAQINFLMAKCYRNIGQIVQANKELERGFLKFEKYKQITSS